MKGTFGFPATRFDINCIIFGADMSLSVHIDNEKKDILILGKGPTQGIEHTLTAEKLYSINFTKRKTKFCFSLHYNGANSVNYDAIAIADILGIHKHLMKKHDIK